MAVMSTALQTTAPTYAQQTGPAAGSYGAGAVNWHMNQQLFWQRNAPYMFRPSLPSDSQLDIEKDDPVVLYSSPDVQGTIVPPEALSPQNPPKIPEPDQIRIK
ncbi:MAG: hypothetical protein VKJ04_11975 [Vampirovibrionales bacterium]|nr:hypothetical protein [Vampirovibrionales bacterium]